MSRSKDATAPGRVAPTSPAGAAIRVVLAESHATMRRRLRLLLGEEGGIEVVAEANQLSRVVSEVESLLPGVLVLDLSMSNGSSLDKVRELRSRLPHTQIVVLTMEASIVFAEQALGAGALGYVLKHASDLELADAVRHVARGEEYVSPRVRPRIGPEHPPPPEDGLSARETEVLGLVALGHTSAEIAHRLDVSTRTVETHRARVSRKLGLTTRAELVAHALGRGLLRA